MIYFMRTSLSGKIKIGYSADPNQRIWKLQTANWEDLEIIGKMDGDFSLESALHKQFDHLRISSDREWFNPGSDLIDYIKANTSPKEYCLRKVDSRYQFIFPPYRATMGDFLRMGAYAIDVIAETMDQDVFVNGWQGTKESILEYFASTQDMSNSTVTDWMAVCDQHEGDWICLP